MGKSEKFAKSLESNAVKRRRAQAVELEKAQALIQWWQALTGVLLTRLGGEATIGYDQIARLALHSISYESSDAARTVTLRLRSPQESDVRATS
jgi:hypothetical protein